MKKHFIYLFLLGAINLNAQAIEADIVPASDRFVSCFVNDSSESLCWQQMQTEPNPAVRYDFGVHYANGDGVRQDFSKGRYWIHQAALKNYPLAQYNLGVMFFDGIGGSQSKECAVHWLNKSASEGDETREMAQQALAALFELTASAGGPKVYRVLTEKECEQLPEMVFPRGKSEPALVENISDSQLPEVDEVEQLQDTPVTHSLEADMLSADLPVEPNLAVQSDEGTVIATENIEPEPGVAETVISVPAEVLLAHDEPRIPDHPAGTTYDQSDVMAISPDEIDVDIPLETSIVEVAEPTAKLSEDAGSEVTISSPTAETRELASPKREETTLPVITSARAPEPTETIAPAVPNIAPGVVKKAVPRTLNLGGALRSAPKGHYTLQLGSASQAEPLQALAKKHKLSNYLVYETQRHGYRWYVLVYGEYAGMTQAKQALQQLPGALKRYTPWIRKLGHVHTEL